MCFLAVVSLSLAGVGGDDEAEGSATELGLGPLVCSGDMFRRFRVRRCVLKVRRSSGESWSFEDKRE